MRLRSSCAYRAGSEKIPHGDSRGSSEAPLKTSQLALNAREFVVILTSRCPALMAAHQEVSSTRIEVWASGRSLVRLLIPRFAACATATPLTPAKTCHEISGFALIPSVPNLSSMDVCSASSRQSITIWCGLVEIEMRLDSREIVVVPSEIGRVTVEPSINFEELVRVRLDLLSGATVNESADDHRSEKRGPGPDCCPVKLHRETLVWIVVEWTFGFWRFARFLLFVSVERAVFGPLPGFFCLIPPLRLSPSAGRVMSSDSPSRGRMASRAVNSIQRVG